MFTYIKLKNYKSLIELEVNLTKKENTPKKLIAIYGENGVGKSNFVDSFYTLKKFTNSKITNKNFESLANERDLTEKNILDNPVDSLNQLSDNLNQFSYYLQNEFLFSNSTFIINQCKTINSTENMVIEVKFKINLKEGIYYIETNNLNIVAEKLKFTLNKNMVN